ncbi:AF4/FMR2 family member 1-like isoform X1 [Chiroxiphia lanceolata]|uniref:AF4/FMR2 family member 1-like isoform X1 n=1 Tax=Chiroxiphia lanceolata TaxID=296741 RepID=UPI0013CEE481|nr:AF4/FMR2 family member 1-like isoform X1 [Chiroxiphia lanceolata]
MEPPEKGKSDESLSKKNRDLLRLEAQEKRRREAPGEKDQFPGKTPIFAKPHKTDNKDALSKRIRKVMGNFNDFKAYMRQNFRKVIWIPKKFKSRSWSRTNCREPSSSQTKTFQSSVMEQPLKNSKTSESPELEPFLEKSNSTDVSSVEDILREMTFSFSRPVSPLHTPPKAEPSELRCSKKQTNSTDVPSIEDILREMTYSFSRPVSPLQTPPKAEPSELPCSTKQTNTTDVPSIEDILREMTYSFSRPVSPLQTPPKAEPAKLPCSTKDTDGSAAQNQVCSWTTCSSVIVRRVMTTRLLKGHLLHLLLQGTACSWMTCSSVTVRRVMTTKLLKNLLLHLFLQETVPYSPSPGVWHHLHPAAPRPVTQRAPPTWRWRPPGVTVTWATLQVHQHLRTWTALQLRMRVVEKPPSPLGGPRSLQSSSSESGSTSDSESSSSPETTDSESSSGSETHHTGGVKRPGKPLVHNGAKRCRKEDSNPDPLEIRAQSSRDKQRVKKRAKPESTCRKDLKPTLQEPLENRKGSQQAEVKQPFALGVKELLSPVRDPAAPEPVRVKEEHQRRAETKDLPCARKRDLKRRAMDSPDEPSGKKKRGEI